MIYLQLFTLFLFSALIALLPFALGMLLGFGGYIATPIIMPFVFIVVGMTVSRTASKWPWLEIVAISIFVSSFYSVILILGEMGATAWDAPFQAFARMLHTFIFVAAVCGMLMFLGAWLWTRMLGVR